MKPLQTKTMVVYILIYSNGLEKMKLQELRFIRPKG